MLDAVEAGAMVPEADPNNHSVGYSGYPDRDGHVTLDAVIMDDTGRVGAVAALEDTMHAISVARRVMEKTPHTLLVGEGATRFAKDQGFPYCKLLTPESEKAWREWLKTAHYQPEANSENRTTRTPGGALDHDTIGLLARDANNKLLQCKVAEALSNLMKIEWTSPTVLVSAVPSVVELLLSTRVSATRTAATKIMYNLSMNLPMRAPMAACG